MRKPVETRFPNSTMTAAKTNVPADLLQQKSLMSRQKSQKNKQKLNWLFRLLVFGGI